MHFLAGGIRYKAYGLRYIEFSKGGKMSFGSESTKVFFMAEFFRKRTKKPGVITSL